LEDFQVRIAFHAIHQDTLNRIWKKSIRRKKIQTAKSELEESLFVLDSVFQESLHQTNGLCQEINCCRLHRLDKTKTYDSSTLNDELAESCANLEQKLGELCEDISDSVWEASTQDFDRMDAKLDEFRSIKFGDSLHYSTVTKSSKLRSKANSMKSVNSMIKRTAAGHSKAEDKEFGFTAAAAKRSEQRRVERFIMLVDLMMCDAVYTVLECSTKARITLHCYNALHS